MICEFSSIGKKYNNEIGVISLTSWKKRIGGCSKTIYSLIKECNNFHIVLVLSEKEFPLKEKELPEDLLLLVENNLIELLWVYENYKTMKKIIFTMQKYKNIPIISADDDCIYLCNYAKEMYDMWNNNKNSIIIYRKNNWNGPVGQCTLYFPNFYDRYITDEDKKSIMEYTENDDWFFKRILNRNNIKIIGLKDVFPFRLHTTAESLNPPERDPAFIGLY